MPRIRNLLDKNKLILYVLIIVIAFVIFSMIKQEPQVSIKPLNENKLPETAKLLQEVRQLQERLSRVEPTSPVKIVTSDSGTNESDLPVLTVISEGTRVPFEVFHEDLSWVRPAYQPYWHSKQGQWSSIPDRIQTSYHRLFVTPWSDGLWNETIHEIGIAELISGEKPPIYDDEPDNTLVVVAIQHKITDVLVLNNQVLLLGTPARTGLQLVSINKQDLIQSVSGELIAKNSGQQYMFQLVTPDGYELDYTKAIINF